MAYDYVSFDSSNRREFCVKLIAGKPEAIMRVKRQAEKFGTMDYGDRLLRSR